MPSLLTIAAATPHCAARRLRRKGQHGSFYVCDTRMTYQHLAGRWRCPACGATSTGHRA